MALALEISITRRLENLLTCWFVDLLARWLVDFAHRTRVRKIIYGVAPNGGARHRGGMF